MIKFIVKNLLAFYYLDKFFNNNKKKIEFDSNILHSEEKSKNEDMVITASLVDIGLSQYEVEWQRIGNMQQSSSLLIALIAIVYSAMISFLTLSNLLDNEKGAIFYWKILLPTISINTIFMLISMFYFIILLIPGSIKSLNTPLNIYKNFKTNSLSGRTYEMVCLLESSLIDIQSYVKGKNLKYILCLNFSTITFVIQIFLIIIYICFLLMRDFVVFLPFIFYPSLFFSNLFIFIVLNKKYMKLKLSQN